MVAMFFESLSASEYAAWYAALVGTAALVWDVWKAGRSGPRLSGSAQSGMIFIDDYSSSKDSLYLTFSVFNVGDRATTIASVFVEYYPNWWAWIRGKSTKGGIVPVPSPAQPIPYKLGPGERWIGWAKQTDEILNWITSGFVCCSICYDASKKLRLRIRRKRSEIRSQM